MRVVFFSLSYPTPWQPTAAVFNQTMVESLRGMHQVEVVAPVPWTQRFRAARGCRTGEHPLYLFPPKVLREHYATFLWFSTRRTLRKLTARFAPDAYVGYWAHPDGEVMLRAAREADRPGIVIVGGTDVMVLAADRKRRDTIRRVLQSADAILTVGRALGDRVAQLGAPREAVTVFHRGVDPSLFSPGDRQLARARLGLDLETPLALWVGRIVRVKGLEVLLDAWALLVARLHTARLLLVGDGPELPSLRSQAARLGIARSVVFAGPRAQSELPDRYRAADVTVLPSLSEGIPNVLLESLACGTPFVASDVGGVREIEGGPFCQLVPPGQAGPLAESLERSLRRPHRVSMPIGHTLAESAAVITRALERAVDRRAQRRTAVC